MLHCTSLQSMRSRKTGFEGELRHRDVYELQVPGTGVAAPLNSCQAILATIDVKLALVVSAEAECVIFIRRMTEIQTQREERDVVWCGAVGISGPFLLP